MRSHDHELGDASVPAGAGGWTSRRVLDSAMALFGRFFAIAWGVSIVLFPIRKGLPAGYLPIAAGLALGGLALRYRHRIVHWLSVPSERRFLVSLLCISLVVRLAALAVFPMEPASDHEMFLRLALGLRSGEGYRLATGPTAFFPPGMPLTLAAWFYVVPPGVYSAKVLGFLIGLTIVPVTYLIGRRLIAEDQARGAAAIMALNPTAVFYTVTIGYELLLAGMLLTIAWLATDVEARGGTWWRLALIGVLTGFSALVKPTSLLFPLMLVLVWLTTVGAVRALAFGAVVAVIMLLVISPWTLRNWRVLGSPVLVSTNGGRVLYAANNPDSWGLAMPVKPIAGEHDEVSRDRLRRDAAIHWIVSNPGAWLRLAVWKSAYTWGTSSSIMSFVSADRMPAWQENVAKALLNVGWAPLFLWCAVASWTTRVWRDRRLLVSNLFIASLFGTHLFFEALSRHHITVLPMLAFVAVAAFSSSDRT